MVDPMSRGLVLALAFAGMLVGTVTFLAWLVQTDFLMGHYSGPLPLLLAALGLLAGGVAAGIVWFTRTIRRRFFTPEPMRLSRGDKVGGVLLALLLIPGGFITLLAFLFTLQELGLIR